MKKINLNKGFTLIELLVVVAIIAILSAVVLSFLGNAKNRGTDAAVKANLNTIRGSSELFASNNGNSFGSTLPLTTPCPAYNSSSTNMLQKDKTIADAIAEAVKRGDGSSACYSSSTIWVIAVGLKTSTTASPLSWCVDSGGASKQVNFDPANSINSATFSCR